MRDLRRGRDADPRAASPAEASWPTSSASTLGATGTHPWSPWQEQRIIDTPHYRLRDELLRYVVWRNNSFGLHVHVAIRGADRAVKVSDGLRAYLPELLAWSASSPFVENVNTGLHSARTQIFTRFFPRCGVPDAYGDWDTFADYVEMLYATGSIGDPTEMWWSVRPHLGFPTVEIRISDAQPLQEEAISLAALSYSLAVRIARAVDEGEPLLLPTNREIEENFWRAIRWGLSGEFIDLRTHEVRPARAAIEELIEWVQPVAVELGTAEYLTCRRRTRPSARSRASRRARRSRRSTRSRSVIRWSRLVAEEEKPAGGADPRGAARAHPADEGLRPASLDALHGRPARLREARPRRAATSSRRSSRSTRSPRSSPCSKEQCPRRCSGTSTR